MGIVSDGTEESAPGAMTLLELIYGPDPAALERRKRPKGVKDPGPWECDPEGFTRYMEAGDWRNPQGVARPPAPVGGGGRVE